MVAASPGRSPAELVPSLAAVPGYFTPRDWLDVLLGVAEELAGTTCASLSFSGRGVLHCRRVPTTASTVHRLGRAVARGVRRGEG